MNKNLKKVTVTAVLIAMEVVLSRFCSINTVYLKIGFGFVPVAFCAMIYGPLWAAACGAAADFIGAVLFPVAAYFPGFTLTAALIGAVFGLFLFSEGKIGFWRRIVPACAINCIAFSFGLNSFWIHMLGAAYAAILPMRAVQCVVTLATQLLLIPLLLGIKARIPKNLYMNEAKQQ